MQSRLPRFDGESLLVFSSSVIPAGALEQHIAKKSMPPRRFRIETSASIGQARGQVEVLVSKLEQGLGLVGIEVCDLTVLLSGALKVLLSQVIQGHGIMRIG